MRRFVSPPNHQTSRSLVLASQRQNAREREDDFSSNSSSLVLKNTLTQGRSLLITLRFALLALSIVHFYYLLSVPICSIVFRDLELLSQRLVLSAFFKLYRRTMLDHSPHWLKCRFALFWLLMKLCLHHDFVAIIRSTTLRREAKMILTNLTISRQLLCE